LQRNHRRLVFLHGFLGCPEDWDEVITYFPEYDCKALAYPFEKLKDAIVIGYSMGGRVALRSSCPKILISTHPGLQTYEEKTQRLKSDQGWCEKLRKEPFEEFLKAWYTQPLFNTLRNHREFPKMLLRRLKQDPEVLAKMLARESLSHQSFTKPIDAFFIHGQLDEKYVKLYQELDISSIAVPDAGHAVHLENPQGCASAIRGILQTFILPH
jgi:2-succinyl-6-hydroxy-2,4-cyclohexadiene-1-carboxylate synthase